MKRLLLPIIAFIALAIPAQAFFVDIQRGDTVSLLAKRYNTTVEKLVEANKLENPNLIYAGDQMYIPEIDEEELLLGATPTPTSSAARKYVEIPDATLFSGAVIGDTSIVLNDFTDIYDNDLTMADFGNVGYGRINPDGDNISESFTFNGVTSNSDGTFTLTGVSTTLAKYPYTATGGLVRSHGIGSTVRISNTAAFYDTFANKENNEIIEGIWRFTQLPTSTTSTPTQDGQLATKAYVDATAFSGAPDGSLTVKGIHELSTGAEAASTTAIGGGNTTAPLVLYSGISTSSPRAAGSYVVITSSTRYINNMFGGAANSMATLNNNTLVVQNPASATTTPSTNAIVLTTGASSTINASWLDANNAPFTTLNYSRILASSTTTVTVGNTASQTNLMSVSIPANTLGTANIIKARIFITNLDQNNHNTTFRFRYGSTDLTTFSTGTQTQSVISGGYVDLYLIAGGSSASQAGRSSALLQENGYSTTGAQDVYRDFSAGSSVENSASTLNLILSVQHSGADAGTTISTGGYVVELIQ